MELPEEEVVDIEEVIANFRGYDNPFWYEKEKNMAIFLAQEKSARRRLEAEKKRPNTISSGTQPDIEIRWKNYPKQAGTNHMVEFFKEWGDK